MSNVQRVNVGALQAAVEALFGTPAAAVLENLYNTLDHFEAKLRSEIDEEQYEAAHRDGFKEGYDAAMEAVYGDQPKSSSVICLPDQTAEHDAAVAEAVAALECYYEGDSGDEDPRPVSADQDAWDVITAA